MNLIQSISKILLPALLVLILGPGLPAQNNNFQPDTLSTVHPWTKRPFPDRDTSFRFAVISDLTGGYREANTFPVAVEKINRLAPEFIMSVGDLIEGYTEDSLQIARWWNQFDQWVGDLQAPFFYVPGNHDLTNAGMTRMWQARYGRTYYHFIYRNVLFLVLNTEDGYPAAAGQPGRISPAQVAYFQRVLAQHPEVQWTLLFMHRPIWLGTEGNGLAAIEALLQQRPYTVFAGHAHTYLKDKRHGRDYYVFATTGGGSNLNGPAFGEFDQIAWVTMTPSGPRVANLALEGILDNEMRTPQTAPHGLRFLSSSRISYLPIFATASTTRDYSAVLLAKNAMSVPLRLQGKFFQHPVWELGAAAFDTTLAPGQNWRWPVNLHLKTPTDPTKLQPIELAWEASADAAGQHFEKKGVQQIRVAPFLRGDNIPAQAQVDGNWAEWGPAPKLNPDHRGYFQKSWRGTADLSFAVRVAYNDTELRLALRVFDDSLLYNPYRSSWEQEGALLTLTLPEQGRIRLGFSPTADPNQPLIDVTQNWPNTGKIAVKRLPDGFIAELALPRSALTQVNGRPFDQFQLQWTIYDHDGQEDQYQGTEAFWLPDFPGSGTYSWPQR